MTAIEELKKEIKGSIHYMTEEKGYGLVKYWFGNDKDKCACPLACVIAKSGKSIDGAKVILQIQEQYKDLPEEWIGSFIDGFDGLKFRDELDEDAFKFGEEIFKEYQGKMMSSLILKIEEKAEETKEVDKKEEAK